MPAASRVVRSTLRSMEVWLPIRRGMWHTGIVRRVVTRLLRLARPVRLTPTGVTGLARHQTVRRIIQMTTTLTMRVGFVTGGGGAE